ncbi:DUF6907 domain-containing protein [Streptomyces sp. NBC_00019]|uniref:DUF6907 domain-containing protein n=1 Tax=Streptomyces sp. NBC_00019 TaxID=2975623 RepID=UPI00324CDD22
MTAPRTITLPTVDHGNVTVPEPSWCTGHDGQQPGHRVDIVHKGPNVVLSFLGAEILAAGLAQCPFTTVAGPELGGPTVGVSVYPPGRVLTPVALYDLAATLDAYADRLRGLADELAALIGGGS